MIYEFLQALVEHLDDIFPFDVWRAKAFGPANEDTMVDALLSVDMQVIRIDRNIFCKLSSFTGKGMKR